MKNCVRALALTLLTSLSLSGAQAADNRAIEKVAGDVYRFQNNFHYSLVTVTETGVVVVDPINEGAASWLKANLSQITDKPITHLIYSHSHGDHASGGKALGAQTVVAQENFPVVVDGVAPNIRFSDEMSLRVGGKIFEMTYLGEGHGSDMLAVIVRPENVAFITDVAAPKRLPYQTIPSSSVDGWIDQVRKIETLDFEIFAPAHGNVGVKADATDARIYMEELRTQVLAGLRAGQSVEELQSSVTMDAYQDWASYENWRALNVQGMANYLVRSGKVN